MPHSNALATFKTVSGIDPHGMSLFMNSLFGTLLLLIFTYVLYGLLTKLHELSPQDVVTTTIRVFVLLGIISACFIL